MDCSIGGSDSSSVSSAPLTSTEATAAQIRNWNAARSRPLSDDERRVARDQGAAAGSSRPRPRVRRSTAAR